MNTQRSKVPAKKVTDIRSIRQAKVRARAAIPVRRTIVEGRLAFSGDTLRFSADKGGHISLYIDGEWADVLIETDVDLDMSGESNGVYYIFIKRTTLGVLEMYATATGSASLTRIDGVAVDAGTEHARAIGLVFVGAGNKVLFDDPDNFTGLAEPIKLAWGDLIEWVDTGGTDATAYMQTYIEFMDDLLGLLIGITGTNGGAHLAFEAKDAAGNVRPRVDFYTDGTIGEITWNSNEDDVDQIFKDAAGNDAMKVDAATGEVTIPSPVITDYPLGTLAGNGNKQTVGAGATGYAGFGYTGLSANSADVRISAGSALRMKNFTVETRTAQAAGGALVLDVMIGGVARHTINIPAGTAAGVFQDTVSAINVSEGQSVWIRIVNNGAAASAQIAGFSIGGFGQ